MTVFWGLMIPFLGTSLGAACVFLMKKDLKPFVQKGFLGICIRRYGSGIRVVASDSGNGNEPEDEKICLCSGGSRIFDGYRISASHGFCSSSSPYGK